MANMSASILRNLVSSIFNVDAKEVILSGQMPTTWKTEAVSTSGNLYSSNEWNTVWGFCPKTGFQKIEEMLMTRQAKSNANGTWENSYGYTAEYLMKKCDCALFFLVNSGHSYNDCNGRDEESDNWTIYKAPDFSRIWEKVEQKDVQRWEEWIKE